MRSNRRGFTVVALFVFLSGGLGVTAASNQQNATTAYYVVDPTWPRRPERLTWGQTPGITLDRQCATKAWRTSG
jgi:hypothetical protein